MYSHFLQNVMKLFFLQGPERRIYRWAWLRIHLRPLHLINTYMLHHNYKTAGKKCRSMQNKFTYLRYKHKAECNGAAEYYD